MKVTLISSSDLLGGAGVVTYRLMNALRHAGVDARMLVLSRLSDDKNVAQAGSRLRRGRDFFVERARIFGANGFRRADLFKVSYANTGQHLWKHPWVQEADAVCLNWINQGLLSLEGIRDIAVKGGKPIVWTMHDMWCATGICHHAYECMRFTQECGRCPFLHSDRDNDLSHSGWLRKKRLYDEVAMTFVAVSNWLAERCAASSLMRDRDVRVIPNAFPAETFSPELHGDSPMLPADFSRELIVMGAARLDDPVKGLGYAIDALNHLFDNYPAVANRCTVVFFGDLRDPGALDGLRFPHYHVGVIKDPMTLRALYSSAKVVLSTSLYETLPGTLIEGQASGCLPVTFGRGGQTDIVTHLSDGYIASYCDPLDIAAGIRWALDKDVDRAALHESVRKRFAASTIAARYIELFHELLSRH